MDTSKIKLTGLLINIYLLLFCGGTFCQEKVENRIEERNSTTIVGCTIDSSQRPVAYSTVRLYRSGRLLGTVVGDHFGAFILTISEIQETDSLKISKVGYRTRQVSINEEIDDDLFKVVMVPEDNIMEAVEVIGQRSPYQRLADRTVVHVEGSILESGLSTLDLLQRSPGLWVDHNGGIKIRGNQGVLVMINDIVQRMSSDELAEYLRMLPSESIKKIEIIPNPGAEYEAQGSGGIVRIQLKRGVNDGVKVQLLGRYKQQVHDPYINGGTLYEYKNRKFFLSGAIAYKLDKQRYSSNHQISYPDLSAYKSDTKRFRDIKGYNARITSSYDISDRQSVALQSTWALSRSDQTFYTYNTHFLKQDTLNKISYNHWLNKPFMLNTTLNYSLVLDTLASTLKFSADHLFSDNKESNEYRIISQGAPDVRQYHNQSPNRTNIYSVQGDLNINHKANTSYSFGAKFVGTSRDNIVIRTDNIDEQWVENPSYSSRFSYWENIVMGYFTFSNKFDRLSIKGGLRAEQTFVRGLSHTSSQEVRRDYLNLFPSAFFLYEIGNRSSSLHFNYAKRLRRPSFKDLNPYTLQIDDFILIQGNENLIPEYVHRLEAGISFKNGINVDLFYSNTQNKIVQFSESIGNQMIKHKSINFKSGTDYGINTFIPVKISRLWNIQNNISYYHSAFSYQEIERSQAVFEAGISNFLKIPKWFDSNINLSYRSAYYIGNTKYADQLYSSLMISRTVLGSKGKLSFVIDDIFDTAREREYTDYQGTVINFYQKRPTRIFGLSISYTIQKGKSFKEKKVSQSNQDEANRIN